MGFFSFVGRVLFASIFILAAWQMLNEFGDDGGPAAELWDRKLTTVKKFINDIVGGGNIHIDTRTLVAICISLQGLGGLLFVLGSNFGVFLLILYLTLTTPLLYDFYNFNFGEPNFFTLLHEFFQCVAHLGGLLFFIGMKNSISRKQVKRKNPKSKTA